jgi:uncharacterized membrane protein YraQ (UPF0718 family)
VVTLIYLLFGVLIAGVVVGYFWRRVSANRHGRVLILGAAVVVAWPGILLLALADRKLTTADYLTQWLSSDEDSNE